MKCNCKNLHSISIRIAYRGRKFVQKNFCVYSSLIKKVVVQAIPGVTFNGQWLAEKISANVDNLIKIGLCVQGIVTNNQLM